MKRLFIAGTITALAAMVVLLIVGSTAYATSSYEGDWSQPMNQPGYWSDLGQCTKYDGHGGHIPAEYDAAIIKGGTRVRVYPDLTSTGAFQAVGPTNPNNGKPHDISWVMKCKRPAPTTTTSTTTSTTSTSSTTTTTLPPTTTTIDPCEDPDTTCSTPPASTTTTTPDTPSTSSTTSAPTSTAPAPTTSPSPPSTVLATSCTPPNKPVSYEPGAPCGPDPCVVDLESGYGYTLWAPVPCAWPDPPSGIGTPVSGQSSPGSVGNQTLPATGSSHLWWQAAIAGGLTLAGVAARRAKPQADDR